MKTKKILSFILAIAILSCIFVMPANAAEEETHQHIEVVILNEDIPEEVKERIITFYTNGGEEIEGRATYGLTCTLFGHKLETTEFYSIYHEARATSPRCLKKTYDYSFCTRCDYEESVLISSLYIVCC